MLNQVLMMIAAGIVAALGTAHLLLTYYGPKLLPRDRALVESMRETQLVITRQTTLWRAWIGFNASHSVGAMCFGSLYGYLALAHPSLLFASRPLLTIGLLTLIAYGLMAIRYWFITPQIGIGLALGCYVASLVVGGA